MWPFMDVYGLAAPLRLISGIVATSLSYRSILSAEIVLFFGAPMDDPQLIAKMQRYNHTPSATGIACPIFRVAKIRSLTTRFRKIHRRTQEDVIRENVILSERALCATRRTPPRQSWQRCNREFSPRVRDKPPKYPGPKHPAAHHASSCPLQRNQKARSLNRRRNARRLARPAHRVQRSRPHPAQASKQPESRATQKRKTRFVTRHGESIELVS